VNYLPDISAQYTWHSWALVILAIFLAALSVFLFKALSRSRRAEAALSRNETNLKSTQEVARIGGFIFDIPKDKLTWFEGTKQVTGVQFESMLSYREFLQIVHPDDLKYVGATWQAALNGSASDTEYRIVVGGEQKWLRTKIEVEFDRMGQPLLAKGFLQDITVRKKSEEEAARLRHDLAHVTRVSTLGQLGQNIAHEVNQPLAAIAANAEAALRLLEEKEPDLKEVRLALGDIVSDQKRASEVVQRIRTLVKKEPPVHTRVDLNNLAEDAVKVVRSDATAKDASILVDKDDRLLSVQGDPVQLKQVVINLLVNSLDALDCSMATTRRITVKTGSENSTFVSLSVSDTGMGIGSEIEPRLFDPFFTTKSQGIGLGLSISRSIVEAHGGTIRAASNNEGGATFIVRLPVAMTEHK
jgi:C4-dicarboxylate-specific signal transduction histidine kinase